MKIILLVLTILFISCSSFATDYKELMKKSFETEEIASIRVEVSGGSVIVNKWDKNSTEVKVIGNDEAAEKFDFFITASGGEVYVKSVKKTNFSGWNIKLKFEIFTNENIDTDINTSGGSISIEGLSGKQILNTSGGSILATNTKAELFANTSGGSISITNNIGNILSKTSGGSISIIKQKGNTKAYTSGGSISLSIDSGEIEAETSGGSITFDYNGENMGTSLSTSGGGINVNLPADFRADAEVKSSGGSVNVLFENAIPSESNRSKWIGKLNGGGEKLEIYTSGGGINIIGN